MNKLCIDVFAGFTYEELLPLIKEIGFDGFFSDEQSANSLDKLTNIRKIANEYRLDYETSHSTIPGCQTIWSKGEDGDKYTEILKNNIDYCRKLSIPILVVHIQPDFNQQPVFEIGMDRLKPIVEYAEKNKVKLAFENINSPEYLFKTLDYFDTLNVGFCYDCGHEACHTPAVRYLPQIGNRLFCTHIHDNDNERDLHLIPFDGKIDFEKICYELNECNYKGNITLELCYSGQYKDELSKYDFLKKSFDSADKIRRMMSF